MLKYPVSFAAPVRHITVLEGIILSSVAGKIGAIHPGYEDEYHKKTVFQ